MSRSRSQRLKGESDATILHLSRKKPLFVPKAIRFVRGTSSHTRQAFLSENSWVTLDESLSQLITYESKLFNDGARHLIPAPIETSAEAFLTEFESLNVDLSDRMKCESFRAFCSSFGAIFSAHVAIALLYPEEMPNANIIKIDPLRNSPAIYILRFLYSFPELMKNENPESLFAIEYQNNLKLLIEFASKHSKYYFVLPQIQQPSTMSKGNSRVVIKTK